MDEHIKKKLKHISRLIGNTPLLEITFKYKNRIYKVYAKNESLNMTGSIKDRMALYILEDAYHNETIKLGDTIVEATSGNTGIAFSAIGKALGHPVTILMPDWMSKERIDLIRSLGAEIKTISHEQGGFLDLIEMSENMGAEDDNVFLPHQFANNANIVAHTLTTGPEIWKQLRRNGLTPDAFVAGVGTGGTVMGVGQYLKTKNPNIKIHPVEPQESPTLSTGYKVGKHRIQGVSDDFVPPIINLNKLNDVIAVPDGDAILMAQKLADTLGIGVGISSGANFIGALDVLEKMGNESVVVTVFADDNKKYLSTDLMRTEPVKKGYKSPDIELLDFCVFERL